MQWVQPGVLHFMPCLGHLLGAQHQSSLCPCLPQVLGARRHAQLPQERPRPAAHLWHGGRLAAGGRRPLAPCRLATGLTFACGLWPRRKIGFIPVGQSVSPCLLKCALQELCISQCSDIFHAKSFADLAQLQVGIGMHWLLACACRAQQPSGLLPRAMPAAGPAAQHTFHPARLPLIARTGARDTGNHIHGGAGQPCRSGAALRPAPAAQPHAVGQQVRAGRSWWCCEKSWQLRMALGSPIRRCPVVHPRCQGVNNQLLGKRSLPPPQDARGGGGAAAGWLPRQPAEAQGPHIAGHQLARWACKGD